MKKTKVSYLLRGTPSALLMLGAGFVMASSADIRAALGMGAAVILSMLLSSIVVSAIHKIIPTYAKMPVYLLIITGFVSIISMFMQAFFPIVVDMLGVHLATLSVSAVVYRDAEEVADHNGEITSIKTALVTGVFFTVVMAVCAVIREILGNATIWGKPIAFLENYKITALVGAFGGYLVLAIVLAVVNKITGLDGEYMHEEHEEKEDK
jgi:electron transport complex protein RnfE